MSRLFTIEQARTLLRQNDLKDGKSITNAFIVGVIVIPFRYGFIVKRLGTFAISEILANL